MTTPRLLLATTAALTIAAALTLLAVRLGGGAS